MQLRTPIEAAIQAYFEGWQIAKIDTGGVARINPETLGSSTPSDFKFRYIDISSVEKGRIDWSSVKTTTFSDAPSRARRVVRPSDIILSTVRPIRQSHAFADWEESDDYVCSTGFAVVRSDGELLPRFLKHLPFSEQVTRQLVAWQCGTNYPAVNERDIRNLRIPVPPTEEQEAIAHILDAVDITIDRTREAIESARTLRRSLIEEAFERAGGTPGKLGKYITDIRYGTSQASNERNWGAPTLRIPNVVGDEISFDDLVYVDAKPADIARLKLSDGDLLLVRTNGNPNYVGRSAIFTAPDQQEWIFASYLIRVRFAGELIPEYVNIFLGAEQGRRELLRRVTTSAGNHNINANSVRLIPLPIPKLRSDQEKIVDLAQKSLAYVNALCEKQSVLEQLKKALMHDLLTGKVRVADVNISV